jgi:hypothetical protein
MAGENVMLSSSGDHRKYLDRSEENPDRYGNWNRDSGPRGWRRRPPGPVFWLVVGIAMLVYAGVTIGPDVSAGRGHGVRGYFVAQAEHCGRSGCSWSGLFRLPGGQVTRRGVEFFGDESSMHAGSAVPALDSGDFSGVYSRHGGERWPADLVIGAIGIALIAYRIWTWAKRPRRRGSLGGPIQNWIGP